MQRTERVRNVPTASVQEMRSHVARMHLTSPLLKVLRRTIRAGNQGNLRSLGYILEPVWTDVVVVFVVGRCEIDIGSPERNFAAKIAQGGESRILAAAATSQQIWGQR